jgi:beta-1,2-mannobiose phosphorylase / 1,2-beta-oligomannan phosphorylase
MHLIKRSPENPVLLPNRDNAWEAEATFNGSVVQSGGVYHIVYRAVSKPQDVGNVHMEVSSIGHARSRDGVHFSRHTQLIKPEYEWEKYGCEDPRVTKMGSTYFIFYTALGTFPFSPNGIRVAVAITRDFKTISEKHLVTPFNAKAMTLFPEKIQGRYAALLTVNTDRPPAKICLALFDKKEDLWSAEYWKKWYATLESHVLPLQRTSADHVEAGAAPVRTAEGWLFFHSYIQNYFTSGNKVFGIEAALLDYKNPLRILGRTFKPLIKPEEEYELYGKVPNITFPSGALITNGKLYIYYGAADTTCCLATAPVRKFVHDLFGGQLYAARLHRYAENPIISPIADHPWEASATFNPAAYFDGAKVHLLYRAMSGDNTSVFGYASSRDGFRIDKRLSEPVYVPREDFERKGRPGGNSGCEDARLTKMGETLYLCYTAYNGIDPPRVAMASILEKDFVARRWNWTDPVLISPPGIDDKDACLFCEKIQGKFYFVHRIGNGIWIDSTDDLEKIGVSHWLGGSLVLKPRIGTWDSLKVGLSAPPIKTKKGWLMLYHGVSEDSRKYRAGAVILDLKDPKRVVARTPVPILEPVMPYERDGVVPNVVFPCGAVVIGKKLFVYYGGADRVIGVATAELQKFLKTILSERRQLMAVFHK